jgi:S1-C subfamily serine protease
VVQRGEQSRTLQVQLVPLQELVRQKLGCLVKELTSEESSRLGLGSEPKGLLIKEVDENSPSERAQLRKGYLLTEVDGKPADNLMVLANVVASKNKTDKVHFALVVPRHLGGNYVEYRQGTVDVQIR